MSITPPDERLGSPALSSEPRSERARIRLVDRLTVTAAELSGRWQIPLLMVAIVLLGVSVWRLRPQPMPASFDELLDRATGLKEAGLYSEASECVETLLQNPSHSPDQVARLHGLLAEIIFAHESGNSVHGPSNCRRILECSERSLAAGGEFDAATHRMRALAREWLGQTTEAVNEYRRALDKGVENPWGLRRHIVQLRRLGHDISEEDLHKELDTFVKAADVPLDIQFWAAERKIDSLASQGRHQEAEKFLAEHLPLFQETERISEYDFLRALAWYHLGRHDDAARLLRHLRDQVVPGDPLYARSGWLLGCILQQQAPEYALSLFDDVLTKTVPGPSWAACLLGKAECLAELQKYAESMEAYREVVRIASEDPLHSQIDLKRVRDSATAWYQVLYMSDDRQRAMEYLKLAATLTPRVDAALQMVYARRLAELGFELGKAGLNSTDSAGDDAAARSEAARQYLVEAGEEYLRLAKLALTDVATVTDAIWRAAESFDLAGERDCVIDVLETFVREYADSPRVPEALLQLGRACQAGGDLPGAIAYYQRNLVEFPRTPSAVASLIPLADCFSESGAAGKAEQMLLRIVTPRPGDELALITPQAPEYRDALFRLGDLYIRTEEYEKAIARYEEALERYSSDPRAALATFQLADSYRKSAARIRDDLADPKNIAFKDRLRAMHQERLQRAHQTFERAIERYERRPEGALSALDRLCLQLSHLYSADCVYDLSLAAGGQSAEAFARSLSMYEKAAWLYQRKPIAMSAYVQIINCYLHLGKVSQAWMALQRARWALRNIPDNEFRNYAPQQDRAFWEEYLTWLEKKPTFASVADAG